jgi:phosphoserine aminotransferase
MNQRIYNFNPGPATLPLPVLEKVQQELLNYKSTGMSIMEISHRSKDFEAIIFEAEGLTKKLLGLDENYQVLFMQGGASFQFAMIPLNFLPKDGVADYIITGYFAEKAHKEAVKIGKTHVAGTTKDTNYDRIMDFDRIKPSDTPAYIHITSNNTVFGTQWKEFPDFGDVPLVADMSSDILSRPFDANKFFLIYAGAQKNLGPAGVTMVVIRKDMLEKVPSGLPSMLRYDTIAEKRSLYNTPPCFNIYVVNLVLHWIMENGGLDGMEKHNEEKAAYIYDAVDSSGGFYTGHAQKESRSLMNITFKLPDDDLQQKFIQGAAENGLVGLKGHRSVGGIRASIYNSMSKEGCLALAGFMKDFTKKYG